MAHTATLLCAEAWLIRQGPIEAHFVCLLDEGHDGHHRDPEWGIWETPTEEGE